MKDNKFWNFLAILAFILFAAASIVGESLFARTDTTPMWLSGARMAIAGTAILAADHFLLRGDLFGLLRRPESRRRLLVYAFIGVMPDQFAFYRSIQLNGAAIAVAFSYLSPLLVILWTCLQGRRLPGKSEWIAVFLAVGGVFLISTHGSFSSLKLTSTGLLLGLISAVTNTLYVILPVKLLQTEDSITVTGWASFLCGTALLLLNRGWHIQGRWNQTSVVIFLTAALLFTAVPFTLYLTSLEHIGSLKASVFGCVTPAASLCMSVIILHSRFSPADIAGVGMIIAMVLLLSLDGSKAREKKTAKP